MELREIQAWVLWEGAQVGGLLGPIAVGGGKTLLGLLMPMVMPSCQRAVLFIPPSLRAQLLEHDLVAYGQHWNLPNISGGRWFIPGRPVLHIVAYSELSSPKSSELLKKLNPDLVIADEAHQLRHRQTARTRRFLRYFADNPNTRFCGWSGTVTSKSLRDYAHLAALALSEGSPLPLHPPTVEEWCSAIDPDVQGYFDPGQLKKLCEPGEDVRVGFRRRLVDTIGVVATAANKLGTSLNFYQRPAPPIPDELQGHLKKLRKNPQDGGWIRPDGEELVDALRVSACARELAMGFFNRWRFPRGEPEELIKEWFVVRQEWNRELRDRLQRSAPHLDSPLLCMKAAIRFYDGGCTGCERGPREPHVSKCREAESHPLWPSKTWPAWSKIHKSVYHEEEAVWVSDYLLKDVAKWALDEPGIVWTEHVPVGERLARMTRLPYYGGGEESSRLILQEKGDRSVIASVKAHREGKNLQTIWHRNLVVAPPSDAAALEQCLDAKTEVLTKSGWRGIDDKLDSEVAAYSIADGSIVWAEGRRMERQLGASEEMYGIQNPHLDIRVTSGHRMVHQGVRRFGNGGRDGFVYEPRCFVTADSLPYRGKIPVAGMQAAAGAPLTDAEITFLGLFLTDGNLSPQGAVSIFQSERYPHIVDLCERTLKACNFRWSHSVYKTPTNFGERKHPLHKWTISRGKGFKRPERGWLDLAPYINKNLGPLYEDFDDHQLRVLIEALWMGDGNKTPGTYDNDLYISGTWNICSKRLAFVEQLQSLCVRRGFRCNVAEHRPGTFFGLHISERADWTLVNMKVGDGRPRWSKVEAISGERVWCVEVPTNAIVTRRNGKVAIVGNCIGRTHREGQTADEVDVFFYQHTPELSEALDKAIRKAEYIEATTGSAQKLNYGTWGF